MSFLAVSVNDVKQAFTFLIHLLANAAIKKEMYEFYLRFLS